MKNPAIGGVMLLIDARGIAQECIELLNGHSECSVLWFCRIGQRDHAGLSVVIHNRALAAITILAKRGTIVDALYVIHIPIFAQS